MQATDLAAWREVVGGEVLWYFAIRACWFMDNRHALVSV